MLGAWRDVYVQVQFRVIRMDKQSKSRSLENYPPDIVDRVVQDFDADAIGQAHLRLEDLGSDRLARCALFLARGSIEALRSAVELGRTDYRDLIMAAEYDRDDNHVRDFNRPFQTE
jgi:hypothetical protein